MDLQCLPSRILRGKAISVYHSVKKKKRVLVGGFGLGSVLIFRSCPFGCCNGVVAADGDKKKEKRNSQTGY